MHPLQAALKKDEFTAKLDLVRRTYGSAAAMRLKSEKVAAEQVRARECSTRRRHPGGGGASQTRAHAHPTNAC